MEAAQQGSADEQKVHLDELKQRNEALFQARQEGKKRE